MPTEGWEVADISPGSPSGLAVSRDGTPHLGIFPYAVAGSGPVELVHWWRDETGNWSSEILAEGVAPLSGDLTVDPDGVLYAAYTSGDLFDGSVVRSAVRDQNGVWLPEDIIADVITSRPTLTADATGNLHLSNGFFHAVRPAGGGWSVDTTPPAFGGETMALSADGTAEIAGNEYEDNGSMSARWLKYARRSPDGTWSTEEIIDQRTTVPGSGLTTSPSVAIADETTYVAFAWYGSSTVSFSEVRLGVRDAAGTWALSTISNKGSATALAAGPSGQLAVAFITDGAIASAHRAPGTDSFTVETIDSAPFSEWWPDVAIDARGGIHVLYETRGADGYSTGVRYAYACPGP